MNQVLWPFNTIKWSYVFTICQSLMTWTFSQQFVITVVMNTYIDFLVMLLVLHKMIQNENANFKLRMTWFYAFLLTKGGRVIKETWYVHAYWKWQREKFILTYCESVLITSINNRPCDSIPNIIFPQCYNLKHKWKH